MKPTIKIQVKKAIRNKIPTKVSIKQHTKIWLNKNQFLEKQIK